MKFFIPALAAVLACAAAAPTDLISVSRQNVPTVVDAVTANAKFSVLLKAITAANLATTLAGLPAATVFAPDNEAFAHTLEDLGFTRVTATQEDRIVNITTALVGRVPGLELRNLLLYHVVPLNLTAAQVAAATLLTTSEGSNITVNGSKLVDNAPALEDATITANDTKTTTGWIHTIDHVMFYTAINTSAPSVQTIVQTINRENPAPSEEPICFPASSIVHTADGQDITMADLAAGHSVRIAETENFSPVFLFSHKQHMGLHEFVRVTAASGHSISLSPGHYMYAKGKLTAARAVKVGDTLRTVNGKSVVKLVERVKDFGVIAPHTLHGDIVVNGIVASTYTTAVHPRLARWLLAPLRAAVRIGLSKEPLGSILYDGSPRASKMVPGGPDMF